MKADKRIRQEAKSLFRACLVEGRLEEDRVRQAAARVLERRPRGHLRLLERFLRLVKLEAQARTARVESAVPLESGLRERIGRRLEAIHGEGLSLAFSEDPGLLGGVRIQVGSDVYDGSLRSRLSGIAERFSSTAR